MGWSAPRTWVSSEVVTAAIMNQHVRDNLLALNGYVLKTANEPVTSSAVMQDDNHLFYTIGAVGTYIFDIWVYANSAANAAGDIGFGFSFPTGTLAYSAVGADAGLASSTIQTGQFGYEAAAVSGDAASSRNMGLSTSAIAILLHGVLTATATGTLRLRWAQAASNASASTVLSGSHMRVVQVA